MTNEEFSNTFDTLLNSYNTEAAFGNATSFRDISLDEYEKSVILTQAQDIVIKSYFDRTLNAQGQGFDDTSRRQIDFSSLIKVATLTPSSSSNSTFDDRGILYDMPKDSGASVSNVLFILNEKLLFTPSTGNSKNFVIVPISYKEYDREMSKPYAQPLKKQAWRLFQNSSSDITLQTELIPRWDYKKKVEDSEGSFKYKIRYVKRPRPIILEDLPDGLQIDGKSTTSTCELNPIIHMDILTKAVEITVSTRGGVQAQPSQNSQNSQ